MNRWVGGVNGMGEWIGGWVGGWMGRSVDRCVGDQWVSRWGDGERVLVWERIFWQWPI